MCEYSKALHILLKSPVTDDIIKFLTDMTLKVVPSSNYPHLPALQVRSMWLGCHR